MWKGTRWDGTKGSDETLRRRKPRMIVWLLWIWLRWNFGTLRRDWFCRLLRVLLRELDIFCPESNSLSIAKYYYTSKNGWEAWPRLTCSLILPLSSPDASVMLLVSASRWGTKRLTLAFKNTVRSFAYLIIRSWALEILLFILIFSRCLLWINKWATGTGMPRTWAWCEVVSEHEPQGIASDIMELLVSHWACHSGGKRQP